MWTVWSNVNSEKTTQTICRIGKDNTGYLTLRTCGYIKPCAIKTLGPPAGFHSRIFEGANFRFLMKTKICSDPHWRMKMWRIQFSCMLKNEDKALPHFLRTLKGEDCILKNVEDWRFKDSCKRCEENEDCALCWEPHLYRIWIDALWVWFTRIDDGHGDNN